MIGCFLHENFWQCSHSHNHGRYSHYIVPQRVSVDFYIYIELFVNLHYFITIDIYSKNITHGFCYQLINSINFRCPKTVENFCVHSRNGYYNGHLIHRVIKGFMIQMGDPTGNDKINTNLTISVCTYSWLAKKYCQKLFVVVSAKHSFDHWYWFLMISKNSFNQLLTRQWNWRWVNMGRIIWGWVPQEPEAWCAFYCQHGKLWTWHQWFTVLHYPRPHCEF